MILQQSKIAIRFTLITTLLLGLAYPLAVTAFAHLAMPAKADGQLVTFGGRVIGSQLIAQSFASDRYFHPRPSAAGNGFDATASGGSNYAQSNQKLVSRIAADTAHLAANAPEGNAGVPIDLVTASGSGLDPDISPAGALYQASRVARARHLNGARVIQLVRAYIQPRQFGILGEPRVNVLELNLALDELRP